VSKAFVTRSASGGSCARGRGSGWISLVVRLTGTSCDAGGVMSDFHSFIRSFLHRQFMQISLILQAFIPSDHARFHTFVRKYPFIHILIIHLFIHSFIFYPIFSLFISFYIIYPFNHNLSVLSSVLSSVHTVNHSINLFVQSSVIIHSQANRWRSTTLGTRPWTSWRLRRPGPFPLGSSRGPTRGRSWRLLASVLICPCPSCLKILRNMTCPQADKIVSLGGRCV
jgi:hypothetical protein